MTIAAMPGEVVPGLGSIGTTHIDGAIGTSFLDHFLATIDYRRKLLVLRPASDSAAFEADAARRNADLRPMWLVGDHFLFATAHVTPRRKPCSTSTPAQRDRRAADAVRARGSAHRAGPGPRANLPRRRR